MHIRVGIPRGLLYYYYYSLWIKFFERLGAEVVVSECTNKTILDHGVKNTVDEACLPVKVYHGHIMDLRDRVDYIFLPKIMSIYRSEFICPKFCGLPEMVKSSIDGLPELIEPIIDFRKSKKCLHKIVCEVGHYITRDKNKINNAFKDALKEYYNYKTLLKKGILPMDILEKNSMKNDDQENSKNKIVLLGHPYILYDSYLSMNIIQKLRKYQLEVMTQDSFNLKVINEKADTMDKKMFWSFGRKILGAALYAMEQRDVKGIIYISSFGCGLDSVIADIVERRIRRNTQKPFTLLTLDEHTGEAGMDTRIEAFVDMIKWRDNNENNFSSHGKYLSTY